MKLKKVISLAAAALMAVSMLAGCSGKSTGNNNVVVNEGTTSIVSAVNDGQSSTNKVKITFTSNSVLADALKTIVAQSGDNITNLEQSVKNLTGITSETLWTGANGVVQTGKPSPDAGANGEGKKTELYVAKLTATNEAAAKKMVANAVDEIVSKLVDTTKNSKTAVGDDYYTYTYTGTVEMISATTSDGVTTYYVAGTITQVGKKDTWKRS